jgi:hypothetical protein
MRSAPSNANGECGLRKIYTYLSVCTGRGPTLFAVLFSPTKLGWTKGCDPRPMRLYMWSVEWGNRQCLKVELAAFVGN